MTSLGDFFPKRAIRLKNIDFSWRRFALALLLAPLFTAWSIYSFNDAISSFSSELYIKNTGAMAQDAHSTSGSKCTRWNFIIVYCDFNVTYNTSDGTSLKKALNIVSIFESPNTDPFLKVRYDPADPERISTNWGASVLTYRIAGRVVFLGFLIIVTVAWVVRAVRMPRRIKDVRAAGRNPTPIAVQFTRSIATKYHLQVYYLWKDPSIGQQREGVADFGDELEPFWLNTEKRIMLALLSPTGKAYLLDADLTLTDLTEAEKDKVKKLTNLFQPEQM